ncbi:MAG TPA: hypothetical protein VMI09_01885 [Candidatus Binataceae bacterium]|nr:hypothetical protein [Candidatus Binataceae bacterium]
MSINRNPSTRARGSIARMIDSMWLIPFAAAVWFVAKYSVDVPDMDQWGLPSLFDNAAAGRPVLPGLLTCNNEHPVLFPKLIFLALAFTTRWNTRVEMAVTLLSALAMFTAIARLAAAEERDGVTWTTAISLFVASLLVFSFVHYDDWLWGWQLMFVLANTCAVLAVYLISNSIQHPLRGQILAWTCCLVASFSALYGLLSWLVIIPAQLSRGRNKRRAAAAAIGSVLLLSVAIAVYFLLLERPFLYPVDRSFWLGHPIAALEFLCALVGAPLAHGNPISPATLAPFLGCALIALFAACAAWLIRANRFPSAAPWIAIGLFGLGFAAMNTLGRSAWAWALRHRSRVTWAPVRWWRSLHWNYAGR